MKLAAAWLAYLVLGILANAIEDCYQYLDAALFALSTYVLERACQ